MLKFCSFIPIYCIYALFQANKLHASVELLEDFSQHTRVRLRLSDEHNNPINSTKDQNRKGEHLEKINIDLKYNGKQLTMKLSLNRLVHIQNKPNTNCYYLGSLHMRKEGGVMKECGDVAISACQQISGWMWFDGRSLHLIPSDVIGWYYLLDDAHLKRPSVMKFEAQDLNLKIDRKMRRRKRGIDWPYDHDNNTLIVELVVVNDYAQFENLKKNLADVEARSIMAVNIINSFYRPLNIYIALVGIETWNVIDKLTSDDSRYSGSTKNKTLELFLRYRERFLNNEMHNDNAQLISGKNFRHDSRDSDGVVGKAPIMTMCSWTQSGGINIDQGGPVSRLAVTMAHELGHNLGMGHDSLTPGCPDSVCLMSSSHMDDNTPTKWSEESKEYLKDALHLHIDYCLHNLPTSLKGTCGNGFVDPGEECDCGLPQDCTNKCCEANTCKLTSGSQCSSGLCCHLDTCQLKGAYVECRRAADGCDLPEFCDGVSESCPADVFKHNGFPCQRSHTDAYCYEGRCRTHDSQCQMLWGKSGMSSKDICYENFNLYGNVSGNCGYILNEHLQFLRCEPSDVMCGMVHCEHQNEKIMFWKDTSAHQIVESSITMGSERHQCHGVVYNMGDLRDNPGLVPDGAACGKNKICVSKKCRLVDDYISQLGCPHCHSKGVCNSLNQCHCNDGYQPPTCEEYGGGGSLHSNSALPPPSNAGKIVGITLTVLFLVAGLIFLAFKLLSRRNFILKEFSLSPLKSTENPKKKYHKEQQFLRKQQQQNQNRLPSGFMAGDPHSTALLNTLPAKMPVNNPPPPRPPKSKLSSQSFSRELEPTRKAPPPPPTSRNDESDTTINRRQLKVKPSFKPPPPPKPIL